MSARRPFFALALTLVVAGVVGGVHEAHSTARREHGATTPLSSVRGIAGDDAMGPGSARLLEVELEAGTHAFFELCSESGFRAPEWRRGLEMVVWSPNTQSVLVRSAIDAKRLEEVPTRAEAGCLMAGEGVVPEGGGYSFELVWAEAAPAPPVLEDRVWAHSIVRPVLGLRAYLAWLLLTFGVLSFVLLVGTYSPAIEPRGELAPPRSSAPYLRVIAASVVTGVSAFVLLPRLRELLPIAIGGLLLAFLEASVALTFLPGELRHRLKRVGATRPTYSWPASLGIAGVGALTLFTVANAALLLVPSTGESPIQRFVSWPSGQLSFALVAALAPLAEELFFRGFVYGLVEERSGARAASTVSFALFAAAHVPQVWGNWGGLVAVLAVGVVLTAQRRATGSIAVPALTHLLYNAMMTALTLR